MLTMDSFACPYWADQLWFWEHQNPGWNGWDIKFQKLLMKGLLCKHSQRWQAGFVWGIYCTGNRFQACLLDTWAYQKLFSCHIAFAAGASAWVSSESKNIFLLKWINSWRYSIVNEWHVMKLSPEWY